MSSQRTAFLPWKIKPRSREEKQIPPQSSFQTSVLQETVFSQMLRLERRRTERSGRPFMLVLISSKDFQVNEASFIHRIAEAMKKTTRETDFLGWYEENLTLGLLMTEMSEAPLESINVIRQRISATLHLAMSGSTHCSLTVVFHVFPQDIKTRYVETDRYIFYPDYSQICNSKKRSEKMKRAMDIVGSIAALTIFSPLFIILAFFIKINSKGPVLFSQKRVGEHGREFKFFKFRTMHVNNDSSIHREYTAKLIAGQASIERGPKNLFKLVNDPRITFIGKFLRKSSLDELPQFINVLMGSMSLVGPRPPLLYEYQRYKVWHKRRVLELKPGLTGLWQVEGRSRTTFDEMVRLDIRYLKKKSVWVDTKILLRTPMAIFTGNGAC